MNLSAKRHLPLFAIAVILLAVVALLVLRRTPPAPPPPAPAAPALSLLAAPPDWKSLEIYQNTITRGEFERPRERRANDDAVGLDLHCLERRPFPQDTRGMR